MRTFLRSIALLLCIAAGVGAAVWLAQNTEPVIAPTTKVVRPAADSVACRTETSDAAVVIVPRVSQPAENGSATNAETVTTAKSQFNADSGVDYHLELPSLAPLVVPSAPAVGQQEPQKKEVQVPISEMLSILRDIAAQRPAASPAPVPTVAQAPAVLPAPPPPTTTAKSAAGETTEHDSDKIPVVPDSPSSSNKAKGSHSRNKSTPQIVAEGDNKLSIHLVDSDIREALQLLSRGSGIAIMPSDAVQGNVTASLPNVDFDTALGAIVKTKGLVARREGDIIYIGSADDFKKRDLAAGKIITRIYRPNYVRASELQKLLTPLLTPQVGTITVTTQAVGGIPSDNNAVGGDEFANGDALLVRDYESVLEQIDNVFKEVDTKPLQVAIEAMILAVKLSDQVDMGVDFELLRNQAHIRIVSGVPVTDLGTLTTGNGLKVGFLDSSLSVFLKALETIGDTNVIATPRLLVLNKMRAEIIIGSQLGYVSTTVTETSTTQAVQFLEVGTQLRLRPFISSDGMIRMEVHPELSTGSVKVQDGFTLPDKELTGVTTNIMARDGATVIIGGLIREDLETSSTQIPLLGSLPAVGGLFRQKTDKNNRSEIIVLITPHIIYEPELSHEGNQGAMEFHHRQAVFAEKMSPFSQYHLSRKYFFLAQEAWAAGKQERALRLVNLAIHFDRQNRAALDLRADIAAGNPVGEHTQGAPFIPPSELQPLDGNEISPWILDRLDPAAPPETACPQCPQGTPGRHVDISPPGGK